MAIDGILLSKIATHLNQCCPCKIQKISQISEYELVFNARSTTSGKFNLFISAHPATNHISIIDTKLNALDEPKGFVMLLRKYLEQAVLVTIDQKFYDRWLDFHFKTFNNLGDPIIMHLIVELMGKYANIILVDDKGIIVDAIRRIPPFQNQLRTIQPGAKFTQTPIQENKKDPFTANEYDESISLTQQFYGFSKDLAFEIEHRLSLGQSFKDIMQQIHDSNNLFISFNDNKSMRFHCIELTYLNQRSKQFDLFPGINFVFVEQESQERIKSLTNDVTRCVKANLKHFTNKLPKLYHSLDEAKDCDVYSRYGDLLFTAKNQPNGHKTITVFDYELDKEVSITLDERYDSYTNARKFYQKYTKGKKGIVHIEEQIAITQKELDYFTQLSEQLEYMDVTAATQIRLQLQQKGYLRAKQNHHPKKKKKDAALAINSVIFNDVKIYYGKNNIQNEQVTFNTNARKGVWFHVQNSSGAHVLLTDNFDDEACIRFCANLAALFSKYRYSSSVPVQYCPVNKVRKLPKGLPGQVLLDSYKTIYIDPDIELLAQYNL